MHPSLFYSPGASLSAAELGAARLDGLLVEIGEGYMPADVPEDSAARMVSIRMLLPDGYAAAGPTAAWVLGVGHEPPRRHHAMRASARRPRVTPRRNLVLHDVRRADDEIVSIAGMPLTTLPRTLRDLAFLAANDPECADWARRTVAHSPGILGDVRRAIADQPRVPGKRAALAVLDAATTT